MIEAIAGAVMVFVGAAGAGLVIGAFMLWIAVRRESANGGILPSKDHLQ